MTQRHAPTLVAVGDIMLGRGVQTVGAGDATQLLDDSVQRSLVGDIVTGNLECLLGTAGDPSRISHSHFQSSPTFALPLLKQFHVLNLANNHIDDFGDLAIAETIAILEGEGIGCVGVGSDREAAVEPYVRAVGEVSIAVFGATTVRARGTKSRYRVAQPGKELYHTIRRYADQGHFCVLHLHAGAGDFPHPSPGVRHVFEKCSAAGAQLVLGHHPHVLQGRSATPSGTHYYSLGDFIFDRHSSGRGRAAVLRQTLPVDGSSPTGDVLHVKRLPSLVVELAAGEDLEAQQEHFTELCRAIANGRSDEAYRAARGSQLQWIASSVASDFAHGGPRAVWEKIKRIDRHRIFNILSR